jgi:anti-anti-sigma factor
MVGELLAVAGRHPGSGRTHFGIRLPHAFRSAHGQARLHAPGRAGSKWGEPAYHDGSAVAAAGAEAAIAAAAARRPWVVADLAGVEFIDCSGLAALARVREQAQRAGGDLLLAAVQKQALRPLILTELISIFSVHASTGQAVAAVDHQPARPPAADAAWSP